MNLNKSDVTEDISIADRQGSGQQLNKESFTFDIVNDKETKYISLAEFEQQGYGKIDFVTDNDFNLRFIGIKHALLPLSSVTLRQSQKQANIKQHLKIVMTSIIN